jgi:hypothetical protein
MLEDNIREWTQLTRWAKEHQRLVWAYEMGKETSEKRLG